MSMFEAMSPVDRYLSEEPKRWDEEWKARRAECTPDHPCCESGYYTCKAHSKCVTCEGQSKLIIPGAPRMVYWLCRGCGRNDSTCVCQKAKQTVALT